MGDSFYRSNNATNGIKVLKEKATEENPEKMNNRKYTYTNKIVHNKERHI